MASLAWLIRNMMRTVIVAFATKGRANTAGTVVERAFWNTVWLGLSCESPQTMRTAQTNVPRRVRMGKPEDDLPTPVVNEPDSVNLFSWGLDPPIRLKGAPGPRYQQSITDNRGRLVE